MKKALILSFVCLLFVSTQALAFFDSDVDKAKDFMEMAMYDKAIELLNKRINDKPRDLEAHYHLGLCYMATGRGSQAEKHFQAVVKKDPDYGQKVGREYKQAGLDALIAGNSGKAKGLFSQAVKYQPDLKAGIAKKLLDKGKALLNQNQSGSADSLLSIAVSYDPTLKAEVDEVTKAYGHKLLALAKEKPKKERKPLVEQALKYVSQEDVDAVLPPSMWRTVFKKTYTGKGMGEKDGFGTAIFGETIMKGDKIIFTCSDFEIWDNGWKKCSNEYVKTSATLGSGKPFGVRVPKGEKITVEVQRLVTSY
jgi:tetratricopeptide (TPR) repeat protein